MNKSINTHKGTIKNFRMICNRSGSIHLFQAKTLADARNKALKFFGYNTHVSIIN